jgi:chemotaxis methyl-accepting protein methylase
MLAPRLRVIALLLIPCLVADPAIASAFSRPAPIPTSKKSVLGLFTHQALLARSRMSPHKPADFTGQISAEQSRLLASTDETTEEDLFYSQLSSLGFLVDEVQPLNIYGAARRFATERYSGNFREMVRELANPDTTARKWLMANFGHAFYSTSVFFRYPEHHRLLEKELPQIARQGRVNVLSLGSSVAEAFSLANTVLMTADAYALNVPMQVHAIDIKPEIAREGQSYLSGARTFNRIAFQKAESFTPEEQDRLYPTALLRKRDLRGDRSLWKAAHEQVQQNIPRMRNLLRFESQSITDPGTLERIRQADFISMNNVLYQTSWPARKTIGTFLNSMKPGSYLFMAEPVAIELHLLGWEQAAYEAGFEEVQKTLRGVILRKKAKPSARREMNRRDPQNHRYESKSSTLEEEIKRQRNRQGPGPRTPRVASFVSLTLLAISIGNPHVMTLGVVGLLGQALFAIGQQIKIDPQRTTPRILSAA